MHTPRWARLFLAAALDACCVLAFVVIGRASHAHGETLGGIASTAWPFLAGLAIGWLAAGWLASGTPARPRWPGTGARRYSLGTQGVVVWLATVAAGMTLRIIAGQGTAAAFIAVALAFLGLCLLGWRLLARRFAVMLPLRAIQNDASIQRRSRSVAGQPPRKQGFE